MNDQNFHDIAATIIAYVTHCKNETLEEVQLHVEDLVRKTAHIEYMHGYIERKREEDERHDDLKGKLLEANEKIARNMPTWSDK